MRSNSSHWPKRLRRAVDLFEDAMEVNLLRRQLNRRGPRKHSLDRPLYTKKEEYLEHAIRIAPSTFEIWNDDKSREVIIVRNRITGLELDYPRRKKLRLSAAIKRTAF